MEKYNILFFHNSLPEYRLGWFNKLSKLANVRFIITNKALAKKIYNFDIEKDQIRDLDCHFLKKGIEGICQMKNLTMDLERVDFVELPPMDSVWEVILGIMIVRACKKNNIKIGYFWEKWEAPLNKQPLSRLIKNSILRIIPKMIYKYSDIIFAVGEKSKEYFISNGIEENRIVILPDVSETPVCEYVDIRNKYSIPITKNIILYLGRILPQKGVYNLINAYYKLNEEFKDKNYLLIAGDGCDLKRCKEFVKKHNIKNIIFTGAVNQKDRGNYFGQSNVFIYPVTYYKGWVDVWGLTINEAIQHGNVVIATDAVGSAYELIKEGINGYRIKPDNIEEIQSALIKALSPECAKTAKIINEEIMKTYCFSNMAEMYINYIKKTLDK